MDKKRVVVEVYAGIASLHSMDAGVILEIRDYDVECVDECEMHFAQPEGDGYAYDQDGKLYARAIYGAG